MRHARAGGQAKNFMRQLMLQPEPGTMSVRGDVVHGKHPENRVKGVDVIL
jgi:hypothetical protein